MNRDARYRSLSIAVALVLFSSLLTPVIAEENGGSELSGRILSYPAGAGVSGASILAYHLSTEQLFTSEPTGPSGQYDLTGLPYGYFDIAVQTGEGIFVADQVVNIAPSATSVLTLTIVPFSAGEPGSIEDRRAFPGTDEEPIGVAKVEQKLRGADFWTSKKGVAILAGGGGAALLLLTGGGGSTSPIYP